jgi:hypothetical protein
MQFPGAPASGPARSKGSTELRELTRIAFGSVSIRVNSRNSRQYQRARPEAGASFIRVHPCSSVVK